MIAREQKAYLLFDGDCGICSWSAQQVQKMDRRKLFVVQPYQSLTETELQRFGITYEQCSQKAHVIGRNGQVYRGAFGVNYIFWHYWPWKLLVLLIYALPPTLLIEVLIYAWVARNRYRLSQWFGLKACLLNR